MTQKMAQHPPSSQTNKLELCFLFFITPPITNMWEGSVYSSEYVNYGIYPCFWSGFPEVDPELKICMQVIDYRITNMSES